MLTIPRTNYNFSFLQKRKLLKPVGSALVLRAKRNERFNQTQRIDRQAEKANQAVTTAYGEAMLAKEKINALRQRSVDLNKASFNALDKEAQTGFQNATKAFENAVSLYRMAQEEWGRRPQKLKANTKMERLVTMAESTLQKAGLALSKILVVLEACQPFVPPSVVDLDNLRELLKAMGLAKPCQVLNEVDINNLEVVNVEVVNGEVVNGEVDNGEHQTPAPNSAILVHATVDEARRFYSTIVNNEVMFSPSEFTLSDLKTNPDMLKNLKIAFLTYNKKQLAFVLTAPLCEEQNTIAGFLLRSVLLSFLENPMEHGQAGMVLWAVIKNSWIEQHQKQKKAAFKDPANIEKLIILFIKTLTPNSTGRLSKLGSVYIYSDQEAVNILFDLLFYAIKDNLNLFWSFVQSNCTSELMQLFDTVFAKGQFFAIYPGSLANGQGARPELLHFCHVFPKRVYEPFGYRKNDFLTILLPSEWNAAVDNETFSRSFWLQAHEGYSNRICLNDSIDFSSKIHKQFSHTKVLFFDNVATHFVGSEPPSRLQRGLAPKKYEYTSLLYVEKKGISYLETFPEKLEHITKKAQLTAEKFILIRGALTLMNTWEKHSVTFLFEELTESSRNTWFTPQKAPSSWSLFFSRSEEFSKLTDNVGDSLLITLGFTQTVLYGEVANLLIKSFDKNQTQTVLTTGKVEQFFIIKNNQLFFGPERNGLNPTRNFATNLFEEFNAKLRDVIARGLSELHAKVRSKLVSNSGDSREITTVQLEYLSFLMASLKNSLKQFLDPWYQVQIFQKFFMFVHKVEFLSVNKHELSGVELNKNIRETSLYLDLSVYEMDGWKLANIWILLHKGVPFDTGVFLVFLDEAREVFKTRKRSMLLTSSSTTKDLTQETLTTQGASTALENSTREGDNGQNHLALVKADVQSPTPNDVKVSSSSSVLNNWGLLRTTSYDKVPTNFVGAIKELLLENPDKELINRKVKEVAKTNLNCLAKLFYALQANPGLTHAEILCLLTAIHNVDEKTKKKSQRKKQNNA